MLFRQFVDDDLGCASYLIGDESAGAAVIVDPAYAIEPYLAEAERRDARIVRTLETHTHADHVSGHGRLALEHDVPVSVHPAGEPEYPFDALADGDTIELGAGGRSASSTPRAIAPSTAVSRSSTAPAATSPGSCSPATLCSSAPPPARTSP